MWLTVEGGDIFLGVSCLFPEEFWTICHPYLQWTLPASPLETRRRTGLSLNVKPFADVGLDPDMFGHVVNASASPECTW